LLDGLQDAWSLSKIEANFRKIVKSHQGKLLEAKRTYWKQRSTIRFVKFGDENTKVFQTKATHLNRRNTVRQIFTKNGDYLVHHIDKVVALWESFKNRLGCSDFTRMFYDLSSIIQLVSMPDIDTPFSEGEIKSVVSDILVDHALGPYGFNGMFMKKCWPIIKADFSKHLSQFVLGILNIEHINGSYITPIPKKTIIGLSMIIGLFLCSTVLINF
jgi:hypothetical protein